MDLQLRVQLRYRTGFPIIAQHHQMLANQPVILDLFRSSSSIKIKLLI